MQTSPPDMLGIGSHERRSSRRPVGSGRAEDTSRDRVAAIGDGLRHADDEGLMTKPTKGAGRDIMSAVARWLRDMSVAATRNCCDAFTAMPKTRMP